MENTMKPEKREYFVPMVELYHLDPADIVCTSPNEGMDNDFSASDGMFD